MKTPKELIGTDLDETNMCTDCGEPIQQNPKGNWKRYCDKCLREHSRIRSRNYQQKMRDTAEDRELEEECKKYIFVRKPPIPPKPLMIPSTFTFNHNDEDDDNNPESTLKFD